MINIIATSYTETLHSIPGLTQTGICLMEYVCILQIRERASCSAPLRGAPPPQRISQEQLKWKRGTKNHQDISIIIK